MCWFNTLNVTPETTNTNSLLQNTASNDIQQHVNSGDVENDAQSQCHYDSESCDPEVMVPDARVFTSLICEQKYLWLYYSVVHKEYLCKFCELFDTFSSNFMVIYYFRMDSKVP